MNLKYIFILFFMALSIVRAVNSASTYTLAVDSTQKEKSTLNINNHHQTTHIAAAVQPIPQRDKSAGPHLLDLSQFYNSALDDDIHHKPGNTLSALPKSIQKLGGIEFDIRGLIQLAGLNSATITTLIYPESVTDIPVNQQGKSVHFLHASAWNIESEEMEIGQYVIHYENGEKEFIPIIYKKNIWDWWSSPEEKETNPVWKGQNERTKTRDLYIRLYILDWQNPHPEWSIRAIDLLSNQKGPGAFIVAITIHS